MCCGCCRAKSTGTGFLQNNPIQRYFASCPDNAFQKVPSGYKPFTLAQRLGMPEIQLPPSMLVVVSFIMLLDHLFSVWTRCAISTMCARIVVQTTISWSIYVVATSRTWTLVAGQVRTLCQEGFRGWGLVAYQRVVSALQEHL